MHERKTAGHKTPANDARRLLGRERQGRIVETLSAVGSVAVASLASQLNVSAMTIRRDLVELEREGRLTRIHGGALMPDNRLPVTMDSEEPSFDSRLRVQGRAKQAIAAAAAEIVGPYRTIAIDVGTTTFLMAPHLRDLHHSQIFTNSVRLAVALDGGAAEVYLAGGRVRSGEMSTGGPSGVAQFEALWFDAAVVGVSGITAEGLFDYSFEDTDLKRIYLRRSGLKLVLCDSGKFQRMSLVHIAELAAMDLLVTDAEPPPALAAALAASRVQIHIAPPATGA